MSILYGQKVLYTPSEFKNLKKMKAFRLSATGLKLNVMQIKNFKTPCADQWVDQ